MATSARASRPYVPLLDRVPYIVYKEACRHIVHDWLKGRIGAGRPEDSTVRETISDFCRLERRTESQPHKPTSEEHDVNIYFSGGYLDPSPSLESRDTEMSDDVKKVYEQLLDRKATNHLMTATSHRDWLSRTYTFCEIIGIQFTGDMKELIRIHDLSKYTHAEILGYSVMFGGMQNTWRQLEGTERTEWSLSLEHHYRHNPHHPEYYYRRLEDGSADNTGTVSVTDEENGALYLDEGILDMLASRGERTMRDDPEISVSKWMDIAEGYLRRYSPTDRDYVKARIQEWMTMAQQFVSDPEHEQKLEGILFGKTVVL